MITKKEHDILQGCLNNIEQLGVNVETSFSEGAEGLNADGIIQIEKPNGQRLDYLVEIKQHATWNSLQPLLHKAEHFNEENRRMLLCTNYVGPGLAKMLKEQNLHFIDMAGNMYFNLPWLMVFIMGYKMEGRGPKRTSLTSVGALKIIYMLLARPDAANWTHRDMATAAGVALGAVGKVLDELRNAGFLRVLKRNGKKHRELTGKDKLLERWLFGYGDKLRRKLYIGTFRMLGNKPITNIPEALNIVNENRILIGGELGATLLENGHLRPGSATLHLAPTVDRIEIATPLKLIPDQDGNITLLRTFGECNRTHNNLPPLPDPLLMYAELLQIDDPRTREFAQYFYQSRINRVYDE